MDPVVFCTNLIASSSSFVALMTAPPTVALWPSKYFVVLWMDKSAPISRGRW